jgi:hypothetical protein
MAQQESNDLDRRYLEEMEEETLRGKGLAADGQFTQSLGDGECGIFRVPEGL